MLIGITRPHIRNLQLKKETKSLASILVWQTVLYRKADLRKLEFVDRLKTPHCRELFATETSPSTLTHRTKSFENTDHITLTQSNPTRTRPTLLRRSTRRLLNCIITIRLRSLSVYSKAHCTRVAAADTPFDNLSYSNP